MDYRPALRLRTGVGEYAHQLAGALVGTLDERDTLVLFSSSWKDRLAPDAVPGASVVDARVPVKLLNYAWHRLGWPPVERLAGDVDVAHALHPLLIPARRAAQVVTVHDLYFMDHPETASAEIRRDYPRLAAPHARRADAVVVNSSFTARQVERRLGVRPERLFVCPPGAPAWKPRAAQPVRGPVLFIGTLAPRKNVARLLDAYEILAARLADPPALLLAGRIAPGSEPLLARLHQPALARHVKHVGYVSDDRREQLFREAAVLVLPSHDEGFGIPALEAMTMGVPVVAANRGALPDLVGDAGLLADPDSAEAIAGAIERLLTDPAFAAECARKGPIRAAGYTWASSARVLKQAYGAALQNRSARPA
jgi:glycosyltransferase involved in cell wall biosynthesis